MIKTLINDLIDNKINLSNALIKSKFIAVKINNSSFQNWLRKELNGYEFEDRDLPKYRRISSRMYLVAEYSFGRKDNIPVVSSDEANDILYDSVYFHFVLEPISLIETQIENLHGSIGRIELPYGQVEMLVKCFGNEILANGGSVRGGFKEVHKVQYQNIIKETYKKLIEILFELDKEFPNLMDDFQKTALNDEKVQNIITNNIYGGSASMQIASGLNVTQSDNLINVSSLDLAKLKEMGVTNEQIEELTQLISLNSADKSSLMLNVMSWLGGVSSSLAASGLYENIPALTDYITKLFS